MEKNATAGGSLGQSSNAAATIRSAPPASLRNWFAESSPEPAGRNGSIPATRTFQALRIAVNDELKSLEIALRRLPECLKPGGRLAVISFHSLEDRRVKEAFRDDPRYGPLMRKPIVPSEEECARNPEPQCETARGRTKTAR